MPSYNIKSLAPTPLTIFYRWISKRQMSMNKGQKLPLSSLLLVKQKGTGRRYRLGRWEKGWRGPSRKEKGLKKGERQRSLYNAEITICCSVVFYTSSFSTTHKTSPRASLIIFFFQCYPSFSLAISHINYLEVTITLFLMFISDEQIEQGFFELVSLKTIPNSPQISDISDIAFFKIPACDVGKRWMTLGCNFVWYIFHLFSPSLPGYLRASLFFS